MDHSSSRFMQSTIIMPKYELNLLDIVQRIQQLPIINVTLPLPLFTRSKA